MIYEINAETTYTSIEEAVETIPIKPTDGDIFKLNIPGIKTPELYLYKDEKYYQIYCELEEQI